VPLLLSKVSVTVPPFPPKAEGLASRIRLPLAMIDAVLVVPPAVNVRPGPPLPPPELLAAMPVVVTVVWTQPLASVGCGTLPAELMPSSVPDPTPRLLKLNWNTTPESGLPRASKIQAETDVVMLPGMGLGLITMSAGPTPGNASKLISVINFDPFVTVSVLLLCAQTAVT